MTLSSYYYSSKVNVVEYLMSMPAVRVFGDFALTIFFGLASRDYTRDRSVLCTFSKKFGFRVIV